MAGRRRTHQRCRLCRQGPAHRRHQAIRPAAIRSRSQQVSKSGQQANKTSGPQNLRPSRPRDLRTSGPQDLRPSGPQVLRTSGPQDLSGVLVVDKPEGPTSHDVVTLTRRTLGVSRIGHTGTLDPMATGVLPLVIGRATRLAQFLTASDKSYDATIAFGRTTDTYDARGRELSRCDARPTREQLETALTKFRGTFEQTPPAFSAKNIGGERSYDIARRASRSSEARAKVDEA